MGTSADLAPPLGISNSQELVAWRKANWIINFLFLFSISIGRTAAPPIFSRSHF